jgi:hypothetical protein
MLGKPEVGRLRSLSGCLGPVPDMFPDKRREALPSLGGLLASMEGKPFLRHYRKTVRESAR